MKNLILIFVLALSSLFTTNATAQSFTIDKGSASTSVKAETVTTANATISGKSVITKVSKYGNTQVKRQSKKRDTGEVYYKWETLGEDTGVVAEGLNVFKRTKRDGTVYYQAVELTTNSDNVVTGVKRYTATLNE